MGKNKKRKIKPGRKSISRVTGERVWRRARAYSSDQTTISALDPEADGGELPALLQAEAVGREDPGLAGEEEAAVEGTATPPWLKPVLPGAEVGAGIDAATALSDLPPDPPGLAQQQHVQHGQQQRQASGGEGEMAAPEGAAEGAVASSAGRPRGRRGGRRRRGGQKARLTKPITLRSRSEILRLYEGEDRAEPPPPEGVALRTELEEMRRRDLEEEQCQNDRIQSLQVGLDDRRQEIHARGGVDPPAVARAAGGSTDGPGRDSPVRGLQLRSPAREHRRLMFKAAAAIERAILANAQFSAKIDTVCIAARDSPGDDDGGGETRIASISARELLRRLGRE